LIYYKVAALLLERGVVVNVTNKDKHTPLYGACFDGHEDIVRLLLDKGADSDIQDVDGSTALYGACYNEHLAIAQILVEKGASMNLQACVEPCGGTDHSLSSCYHRLLRRI
jgi:ankyrin repeat protein